MSQLLVVLFKSLLDGCHGSHASLAKRLGVCSSFLFSLEFECGDYSLLGISGLALTCGSATQTLHRVGAE
jgi:hypothetical protein